MRRRAQPVQAARPVRAMRRVQRWLARLSITERIAVGVITFFVIFGVSFLGQGLYIKAKAELAQVLLEQAWSRTLSGAPASKPWPWADMWPIAKLNVPRLGRSAIVLNGASGEAMAFGPGHVSATPMPGRSGTSVIAAHRDTHFAFLQHVRKQDVVRITLADGQTRKYRVKGFEVVDAQASGIEAHSPGSSKLALVTCWPFGAMRSGPLRYVVHAEAEPRSTRRKVASPIGG